MVRKTSKPSWRTSTNLVRGGTNRSEFAETNEAIFITSGYVYESAEQAQRAFKNQEDRYIYMFCNFTIQYLNYMSKNYCMNPMIYFYFFIFS